MSPALLTYVSSCSASTHPPPSSFHFIPVCISSRGKRLCFHLSSSSSSLHVPCNPVRDVRVLHFVQYSNYSRTRPTRRAQDQTTAVVTHYRMCRPCTACPATVCLVKVRRIKSSTRCVCVLVGMLLLLIYQIGFFLFFLQNVSTT